MCPHRVSEHVFFNFRYLFSKNFVPSAFSKVYLI